LGVQGGTSIGIATGLAAARLLDRDQDIGFERGAERSDFSPSDG
jgi:hypothetical protein